MGLQLPGELRSLLEIVGFTWPAADETKMFEMGMAWINFSGTLGGIVMEANASAAAVWLGQSGQDIEAFKAWWMGEESPAGSLSEGALAAVLTGTGMIICALIILVLKIVVIVQLIIFFIGIQVALAAAGPTFGGSLAEIPILQQLVRTVISNALQEVVWKLVEG